MDKSLSIRDLSCADKQKCKFVVVTGGTLSGLGKGTAISSLGVCLKAQGVHLTSVKIDPYLNVDAGTMSPYEHGECYVLDDGSETDLDLGNYERMLGSNLTRNSVITTGKLYGEVMEKERRGDYLGKTVQIVPHVTDHLVTMLLRAASTPVDGQMPVVTLIEVGGTVGDIESMVFLESLSRLRAALGSNHVAVCHLGYVPLLYGEQKTKPTQATVRQLRESGLEPNYIMARCHEELSAESRAKIAIHCNVPLENVVSLHDVPNTLNVALNLMDSGMPAKLIAELNLPMSAAPFTMESWREMAMRVDSPKETRITVAIVGKYAGDTVCGQNDTYLSLVKAIRTAADALSCSAELVWIGSENIDAVEAVNDVDAVIIPGGFGNRGTTGKVRAVQICRESKIPILGICLGFQMMAIEFARNILGQSDAHSEEMDEHTPNMPVVFMPETRDQQNLGGTMVLGSRATHVKEDTLAHKIYGSDRIAERHRHRYELNPDYVKPLAESGEYICSGMDKYNERVHILEIRKDTHPFFIGTQFHPEFNSRTLKPSPVFESLIQAGIQYATAKRN
eukprot:GHVH01015764.1.p1 GENE.GHVH01015764.1~~GHVH01015764.1.p1  ORF type:complete len:564 (+),score=81.25 GHVH01015764.1:144-1835(+)